MKIIAAGDMNMEEKIFNPYGGIYCSIVCLNVYGYKPLWKLVLHYVVGKAHGLCSASISGNIMMEFG